MAGFEWMAQRLEQAERLHVRRRVLAVADGAEPWLERDGQRMLNLSSNNYLGLAGRADVRAAAAAAAQDWGAGSGSARLVVGSTLLHAQLESRLADFKRTEAALLLNSGYSANLGLIPALVGHGDVVLSDALNHASLIDGCRLSRAQVIVYPHNDLAALERLLAQHPAGRRLVVTDSIFSMDGDLAPLAGLAALCRAADAMLLVDEAHATGCAGPGGRGLVAGLGDHGAAILTMGTLSKALGSFGAFVAGPALVIDYLVNTCRSFIFTTALPPPAVGAALAALALIEREPSLMADLQANAAYLRAGLERLGVDTLGSQSQIVPLLIGDSAVALAVAAALRECGVYTVAIRPPTVPAGTARIRASVMASHSRADLDHALAAFATVGHRFNFAERMRSR